MTHSPISFVTFVPRRYPIATAWVTLMCLLSVGQVWRLV